MAKRKILLLGPIVDFGGREIMTNMLYHFLKTDYDVHICSTVNMTGSSLALKNIDTTKWSTLSETIGRNFFFIKLAAVFTKFFFKRKEPWYFFLKNKLTKSYFDFEDLYAKTIRSFVKQSDLIIYSDELSGKWLQHVQNQCLKYNKVLLFRPSGRITSVSDYLEHTNTTINILAHSQQNASLLKECLKTNVWNIDQTTFLEPALLKINIKEIDNHLVYGYIGRFSEEKGIEALLNVFKSSERKLVIAGEGPLLEMVLSALKQNKNITYIGALEHKSLPHFFEKIDVLIIPSKHEGGPLVGVEAMAAGKLIVSTKVGAMPERLEHSKHRFWFSHTTNNLDIILSTIERFEVEERLLERKRVRCNYLKNNSLNQTRLKYLELVKTILN